MTVAVEDLRHTLIGNWHRRLADNKSPRRNHWQTKVVYYQACAELLSARPTTPLTWKSIVAAARPHGCRSTFYEVAGAHARHRMVDDLVADGRPDAVQLALRYLRTDPVEQLIDETKVWSFWPYRQQWLARAMSPDEMEWQLVQAVTRWARANPALAAANGDTPPACAVEDLVVLHRGQLATLRAVGRMTDVMRFAGVDELPATASDRPTDSNLPTKTITLATPAGRDQRQSAASHRTETPDEHRGGTVDSVSRPLVDRGREPSPPLAIAELARRGELSTAMSRADEREQRRLYTAAYDRAFPIVFRVLTQKVERTRGHHACAQDWQKLTGECLDGFHDDVEALVKHLFTTKISIEDLDGWLAAAAPQAAIDGHRRRRAEQGALQRPRLTKLLLVELGHDPWLCELALQILIWVGVPATAGLELWPLDQWAQDRAHRTGDYRGSTPAKVAAEIETVLDVMRRHPGKNWYAEHVEKPLGRKRAPVVPPPGDDTGLHPLLANTNDHVDDAVLAQCASTAIEAFTADVQAGKDPAEAVADAIKTAFLGGSGAETLDRPPGSGVAHQEQLSTLFSDPARRRSIIERVLQILRPTA